MNHRDSREVQRFREQMGFKVVDGPRRRNIPRSQEGFQAGRENQGKKRNSLEAEGFSENREIPGRQMDVSEAVGFHGGKVTDLWKT